jgi:hypothetical protein
MSPDEKDTQRIVATIMNKGTPWLSCMLIPVTYLRGKQKRD